MDSGETILRKRFPEDEDADPFKEEEINKPPPKPKDDTPEFMKETLKDLPPRWKNWWVRILFSVVMLALFAIVIYMGPFAFMITVIVLQIKCYHEIISIAHQVYRSFDLPWFRSLSWYFLVCSNYFLYGEMVSERFALLIHSEEHFMILAKYHRFISLIGYLIGFILFVLSLVKGRYRIQFYMFGWTHVILLLLVTQSQLLIQNLLEGLIWLVIPCMMVIANDCCAYICGFFFGKTPLIKLSPKKTWEGFIGGGICTIIFGWLFSGYMSQFSYLTCPSQVSSNFNVNLKCEPMEIFKPKMYDVPEIFGLKIVDQVEIIPFQLHSLAFSVFASLVAPFGGFFASGFKRAFKVKDFGDLIPGHGGFVDRFDCQCVMAIFVNVYLSTFIRSPSRAQIYHSIVSMPLEEQSLLFEELKNYLLDKGVIN